MDVNTEHKNPVDDTPDPYVLFDEYGDVFFKDPGWFQRLTGPVHGFNRPYFYQPTIMRDYTRFIVVRKGRQIGATTTFADKMLYRCITNDDHVGGIVSKGQRQSKWAYKKIRKVANNTVLAAYVDVDNKTYMKFHNGSEIHALPSGNTGDSIRGPTFDTIWFTEAAFIPDAVFEAVEPTIIKSGGHMWLESTPMAKSGRFYDAFDEKKFSKYHIPSTSIPDIPAEDIRDWRAKKTKAAFKREILGEFVDQDDTVFDLEMLKRIATDDATAKIKNKDIRRGPAYFLGVDPARMGDDETVYYIVERPSQEDTVRTVEVIADEKSRGDEIEAKIKALHDRFEFDGIAVDETGMGGYVVDNLRAAGLRIDAVEFTPRTKDEIYETLEQYVENENFLIPPRAVRPDLFRQFNELRENYTASGRRIKHPDNGHDDYPDAAALAVHTATKHSAGKDEPVFY